MRSRRWAWSEQGTTEVTYLVSLGPCIMFIQCQTPRWHVLTREVIGGICKKFGVHLYFIGLPVATPIVIPINILVGGKIGRKRNFQCHMTEARSDTAIVAQPQITKKLSQASYLNDEWLLLLGFAKSFALMYIRKLCKFFRNKIWWDQASLI